MGKKSNRARNLKKNKKKDVIVRKLFQGAMFVSCGSHNTPNFSKSEKIYLRSHCFLCYTEFISEKGGKAHKENCHSSNKFRCSICHTYFRNKNDAGSHLLNFRAHWASLREQETNDSQSESSHEAN